MAAIARQSIPNQSGGGFPWSAFDYIQLDDIVGPVFFLVIIRAVRYIVFRIAPGSVLDTILRMLDFVPLQIFENRADPSPYTAASLPYHYTNGPSQIYNTNPFLHHYDNHVSVPPYSLLPHVPSWEPELGSIRVDK